MAHGRWWLGKGFLLTMVLIFFLAGLSFWVGRAWGAAGDCLPQQIDGQCGMSTAYGELLGVIGGALLAVGGTIGASLYWRRKGNV
jgi:Flp pilus assembly pilin Flp